MVTLLEKLQIIYKGGMVKRYHNRPVLHVQNNAEHQYMVASISILLYPKINKSLLMNILWHDIYEYETGDMPWAIKRVNPDIKAAIVRIEQQSKQKYKLTRNLNKFEHSLLKLSEYFECLIFCISEQNLGNLEYKQSIGDCIDQILILQGYMEENHNDVVIKSIELLKGLEKWIK